MRIFILGICGTFMASIAVLAKQLGHTVSGCDEHVYPPMSDQLCEQGINVLSGYDSNYLKDDYDVIIVGNAMKRGNPMVETILSESLPFVSGPEWLKEHVLKNRWVLAVSGTHGKTTTASMLTWILTTADQKPGYLIGGIPKNFSASASIGESSFFVIEADEYDTAFFDKRSKFIHFNPRTLIINNLEYDHADIFSDLAAIQQQFHHLIRIVPNNGLIVANADDKNIQQVLDQGSWTPLESFARTNADWSVSDMQSDGSAFTVCYHEKAVAEVKWSQLGSHNVYNALAAIAAAHHAGIKIDIACKALNTFTGVKRRLEIRGTVNGVTIYDDFAHHPTAVESTLLGLRQHVGEQRIFAVLDFASYTMRQGVHDDTILKALSSADKQLLYVAEKENLTPANFPASSIYDDVDALVSDILPQLNSGDHVVVMSNRGFGGIHEKLLDGVAKIF